MIRLVEFAGPRGTLRGSLHVPDGEGPHAAVLVCHGFTGNRMESGFLFVGLSRALEAAGLASLRFDYCGSGESDGEFREMTASTERADTLAALDFLKSLPEIDAGRVGLMGLSFGGFMTACTLGSRDDVKAAALWSAAGTMSGRRKEKLDKAARKQLAQRGWLNQAGLQLGEAFFDDLQTHRPYDEIARYAGPVLVIHGTADGSVPLAEAEKYVSVLEGRPGGRAEHLFVEGGTHCFDNWDQRQTVYARTVDWFRRHL